MGFIALEEAFRVPGLADRQPPSAHKIPMLPERQEMYARKLPDLTEYRIPEMDKWGIDIQVLSLTIPGINADIDAQSAIENARFVNDYLADRIAENPTRFRGFASLPMQDPHAAADELRRCVEELGFCGAMVCDHTQGHYLDEPQYEVFWTALEQVDRPLYIHPGSLPVDNWRVLEGRPEMYAAWSWQAEVGGHALRLLYSGLFDRHPNATVILGHMGEFLPFQRSRLDSRRLTTVHVQPLERMPSEYIGTNIVLTNSGVFDPTVLEAAVKLVGADAVMFSVDYPYEETEEAVRGFEATNLSDIDRAKVAFQNAERILRLT
jgi:2,3-dihydroxybenzoate decarboxylase